jgi:hypothetical protein
MSEVKHPIFGSSGATKEEPKAPVKLEQNDLKSLIELGCLREEFEVVNKVFVMRTLNASERTEMSARQVDNLSEQELLNIQFEILALAVETVDGQPLEQFHPDKTKDPYIRRKEILSQMQMPIIMELLNKFTEMTQKADGQFSVEQVKN